MTLLAMKNTVVLGCILLLTSSTTSQAQVVINEIGSSGTFGVCGGTVAIAGEDYIELKNIGAAAVDISDYLLHDSNGPADADAYTIPSGTVLAAGELLLLCRDDAPTFVGDFLFGIGGTDEVTLLDSVGATVSAPGVLTDNGSAISSFQRLPDGTYEDRPPTPGAENISTPAPTPAPAASAIVLNEIGSSGTFGICGGTVALAGEDYIELKNTGAVAVDISGYVLHDSNGPADADAYTIPSGTVLAAGELLLLCRDDSPTFMGDFLFGIGGTDEVTLRNDMGNPISAPGPLDDSGSAVLSFQRLADGSYAYATPTPGFENVLATPAPIVTPAPTAAPTPAPVASNIVINEVGDKGTFNTCGGNATEPGEDYIELKNIGANAEDIAGSILHDDDGPDDADAYTFPANTVLEGGGLLLLCRDDTFAFGIGGTDTVTLVNAEQAVRSTTGVLEDMGSETSSYQRLFDGSYEYNEPTPGAENVDPLSPIPSSAPSSAPSAEPDDCRLFCNLKDKADEGGVFGFLFGWLFNLFD